MNYVHLLHIYFISILAIDFRYSKVGVGVGFLWGGCGLHIYTKDLIVLYVTFDSSHFKLHIHYKIYSYNSKIEVIIILDAMRINCVMFVLKSLLKLQPALKI